MESGGPAPSAGFGRFDRPDAETETSVCGAEHRVPLTCFVARTRPRQTGMSGGVRARASGEERPRPQSRPGLVNRLASPRLSLIAVWSGGRHRDFLALRRRFARHDDLEHTVLHGRRGPVAIAALGKSKRPEDCRITWPAPEPVDTRLLLAPVRGASASPRDRQLVIDSVERPDPSISRIDATSVTKCGLSPSCCFTQPITCRSNSSRGGAGAPRLRRDRRRREAGPDGVAVVFCCIAPSSCAATLPGDGSRTPGWLQETARHPVPQTSLWRPKRLMEREYAARPGDVRIDGGIVCRRHAHTGAHAASRMPTGHILPVRRWG
jgi:hypothetical protein